MNFEFVLFFEGSVGNVKEGGKKKKKKQPGYGQIKRADTPINEITSLSNNQIM